MSHRLEDIKFLLIAVVLQNPIEEFNLITAGEVEVENEEATLGFVVVVVVVELLFEMVCEVGVIRPAFLDEIGLPVCHEIHKAVHGGDGNLGVLNHILCSSVLHYKDSENLPDVGVVGARAAATLAPKENRLIREPILLEREKPLLVEFDSLVVDYRLMFYRHKN